MSRMRRAGLYLASLLATLSGFTIGSRLWRRRRGDYRVFILEYHDVSITGEEHEGTISAYRFRRHLRFLKRRFRLTTLSQAVACLQSDDGLSEDLAVLTFDDGYTGNYEAVWPLLAEDRVPATVFLTTGFLDGSELWFDFARRALRAALQAPSLPEGLQDLLAAAVGGWPLREPAEHGLEKLKSLSARQRDRLLEALRDAPLGLEPAARPMSWAQVREMQAEGIEFGGHTVSHPFLSLLSAELQDEEIRGCHERIEAETGKPPASFAFPNGDYNAATLQILRRLGFTSACTTRRGSNRAHCDPLTLRRIGVGADPTWVLATRLSGILDDETRRWLKKPL